MRRILVLLTAGLLAVSLAVPAVAVGAGRTVLVPRPTGGDDTATIQAALDWCVKHGPGCTVELRAGTYHTSQLVTYDFRGTFKGAGKNRTTIEALPKLPVTMPDPAVEWCQPNTHDCTWPGLIIFVDGNIEVSDLALDFPATNDSAGNDTATKPWTLEGNTVTGLGAALDFLGQHRTDASVDRIGVTGRADDATTNPFGFNVQNGVVYDGGLPSGPTTTYTLSGSFDVRSSSISTMDDGIVVGGGYLKSVHGTIGGSPATGNRINVKYFGIDLEAEDGSAFDVSYNMVTARHPLDIIPFDYGIVPSHPSRYLIHDNTFMIPADTYWGTTGILLDNGPADPWLQAVIVHNTIKVPAADGLGIYDVGTTGTGIAGNTITGTLGQGAVVMQGGSHSAVIGNNVSRFGIDPDPSWGLAQYYLDPDANHDLVVCSKPGDTARDDGTSNKVIGCTSVAAATLKAAAGPAAPATPRLKLDPRPRLP